MVRFAYKYIFKGFGWVLMLGLLGFLLAALHGCTANRPSKETRAVENETLKAVLGDPSKAVREFSLETRKAPVKPKYQ